jgi:transposase InsO family protein
MTSWAGIRALAIHSPPDSMAAATKAPPTCSRRRSGRRACRLHRGCRFLHVLVGQQPCLHVDVKKLGRVPDGGGWRVHGRSEEVRGRGIGWDYVHVAIDDHTRLAYAEVLPDEKTTTCASFLTRAAAWFAGHGVTVRWVLTDNAKSYRIGRAWIAACDSLGIARRFIKPGRPWTNGKAERFNRTLQTEWAYATARTGNDQRTAALDSWLQHYNTARSHSALGGHPPVSRLAA